MVPAELKNALNIIGCDRPYMKMLVIEVLKRGGMRPDSKWGDRDA